MNVHQLQNGLAGLGGRIVLSSLLGTAANAQGYSTTAAAEQWAEATVREFAYQCGETDLGDAITAGTVNVYPGNLSGTGFKAVSWPGEGTGDPATIVVHWTPDGELAGTGAVHEWAHISNDHERLSREVEPTNEQLTVQACNECAAHCAVLSGLVFRFRETDIGTVPCRP